MHLTLPYVLLSVLRCSFGERISFLKASLFAFFILHFRSRRHRLLDPKDTNTRPLGLYSSGMDIRPGSRFGLEKQTCLTGPAGKSLMSILGL